VPDRFAQLLNELERKHGASDAQADGEQKKPARGA